MPAMAKAGAGRTTELGAQSRPHVWTQHPGLSRCEHGWGRGANPGSGVLATRRTAALSQASRVLVQGLRLPRTDGAGREQGTSENAQAEGFVPGETPHLRCPQDTRPLPPLRPGRICSRACLPESQAAHPPRGSAPSSQGQGHVPLHAPRRLPGLLSVEAQNPRQPRTWPQASPWEAGSGGALPWGLQGRGPEP